MDHDKLKMQTPNIMEENFKKLQALFPSAVTETIGEDGKPRRTVDADVLRQLIDADVAEGREERYQFTWPEKAQSVLRACAPTRKTLRLDRAKSVGRDGTAGSIDTENIYIEGDNLEVLKILQETYLGKVKMIYIDPPYNTGNDFIYRDDFAEDEEEYWEESGQLDEEGGRLVQNMESSGRFHTNWLNMIYPRLWLARDLLAQDGVIFISIDDNEAHNLRKCCDDVFGAGNFVGQIAWQSRASIQNDTDFSINHEYILVYARYRRRENRRLKEGNQAKWHKRDSFVCRPLPLDKSKFDNPDNDPRGLWKADPFDAPHVRPNLTYPIINPTTGEEHLPPRGRHWRTDRKHYDKAFADNRIVFGKDGTGRPQLKVFYEEKKELGSIDNSWFSAERIGTSTAGTKELMSFFDGISFFDSPKPTSLLKKLLYLANTQDNDLVLDFFSGSATTAHALLQLNAEDGGKRRFIMIQLPEECAEGSEARKAGFANICEIGEERIRRAGRKIREEMAGKADGLDTGFRVFKVDSSNMKDVWYTPEETAQEGLGELVDNIKEDRTAEDLLFQAMLELGIELSAPIAEEEIAGHRVFFVRDGALAACFDCNIKEETLTEIAKRQPLFAVLRDSGLGDDSACVNFEQIFKAYSPNTRRRVI